MVAWIGFDAGGARYIATHCRGYGRPGPPPLGETLVEYAPGLPAWFAPPGERDLPTITMVPGYGADRRDSGGFAAAMQQRGYGILRLDLACTVSSAAYGGGPREANEVMKAVQFAKEHTGNGSVVLFGLSAGGTEALLAAGQGAPVDAVITDSAPTNLNNIVKDWHDLPMWVYPFTPRLYGLFSDRGHLAVIGPDFSKRYAVPTLIIQGTGDTDVLPINGHRLATLLRGTLWLVPGANHGQSFDRGPAAYIDQTTTFLDNVGRKPAG
jgi:pimeloyl-ACP methyl ester carboxylesterase